MRSQPPPKLPNFEVASEARSPRPQVALSPSPPAEERPALLHSPNALTPQQPSFPHSGIGSNPWHALAAMSGAPTPSLAGPSTIPRGSPMLGRPFEQLNIGGSWSGANLTLSDGLSSPADSPPQPRQGIPGGALAGRPPSSPTPFGGIAQRRANKAGSLKPSPVISSSPLSGTATSGSSTPNSGDSGAVAAKLLPLSVNKVNDKVRSSTTLVLDIRPPSSFRNSHLPGAHSIPVPSTLLRRPAFDTKKLLGMLGPATREAVSQWRDMTDIVIVDQESTSASETGVLFGLSSKFDREGYKGTTWFVNGGHSAMEADGSVELDIGDGEMEGTPMAGEDSAPLAIGRLSRMAFMQGSTRTTQPQSNSSRLKLDNLGAFRLGPHSSVSSTDRQSPKSATPRQRLQPANPFFDNIRQNLELSHGGITERIPLGLPESVTRRAKDLPGFLRELVVMPDNESQDLLANQFYRIERGEQKRLQNVMDVLSKGSSHHPEKQRTFSHQAMRNADDIERLMTDKEDNGYYPFSITAGVERGAKNRYKNIWPYDFSRVRLGTPCDDDSDYINASFVQPRGTARRYIATQGPLDATYRDFWTLVWEQNVRVIVMLTKQFEGGLIKCGQYWKDQKYGDIRLRLEVQTGGDDKPHDATTGFDFGSVPHPPGGGKLAEDFVNIKRVFTLSHAKHPDVPPRRVTQVQCINWPDFDVPDAPEILLDLMRDVDHATQETGIEGCGDDRCQFPPVLVHCSAGVGRTGSFILVDAIADGLRTEHRRQVLEEREKAAAAAAAASKADSDQPRLKQRTVSFATTEAKPTVLPQAAPIASPSAMDVDELSALAPGANSQPASERNSEVSTPEYEPRPITQSHKQHKVPTLLSSMAEPILEVLQAMRVQRMSLVQSLRQYVFVYRCIIVQYLAMIDEERRRPDSLVATDQSSADSTKESVSTAATSTSTGFSGDDEGSFKRKSSTTDLQPQMDVRVQLDSDLTLSSDRDGSVNLAKRASFKKRRAANGEDGKGKSVPGGASVGTHPKPALRRGKS